MQNEKNHKTSKYQFLLDEIEFLSNWIRMAPFSQEASKRLIVLPEIQKTLLSREQEKTKIAYKVLQEIGKTMMM